jgi:hypothetical protein
MISNKFLLNRLAKLVPRASPELLDFIAKSRRENGIVTRKFLVLAYTYLEFDPKAPADEKKLAPEIEAYLASGDNSLTDPDPPEISVLPATLEPPAHSGPPKSPRMAPADGGAP